MSGDGRLDVVLCWHMHQPQYRDPLTGGYHLPWTYLHAIKDYVDMAAHLEAVPAARAVVNFAPVLLEQLDDYAAQVREFLRDGTALRDPLLAALAGARLPADPAFRQQLLAACLRANGQRMIERFPPYARLARLARAAGTDATSVDFLDESFFADLVTWYHLAWLGETVRREDARVQRLQEQGTRFGVDERRVLLTVIGELLDGIVPRYRRLAERGQVELSVTPYAHPIVPLLLDFQSAREALPEAPLPQAPAYPGGEERARWHLREGIACFERYIGFRPAGCWPSEGSVSGRTLELLSEHGLRWAASGESVLAHSLRHGGHAPHAAKAAWLYQPYRVDGANTACFFRDDSLSDLIGFTYATWHADDAVANLIQHLENIADSLHGHAGHVVSIILDGENAWEYYPENGYYFLSALYQRLSAHPRLRLGTYSECLEHCPPHALKQLVAGSWVYGSFSTWIGDPDKNRGWEMLADAKHVFDEACTPLSETERAAAARQLAVCEGSDWFWWFGDYNPEASVSDFERLFRHHLTCLYQLLRRPPPDYLAHAFTRGGGSPLHGGTMRPGQDT